MRISAREIEQLVASELASLLTDPLDFAQRAQLVRGPATLQALIARTKPLAAQLHDGPAKLIAALVSQVQVLDEEGVTVQWLLRVLRLAFLSPVAIEALVAGKLAAGVDGTALLAADAIALNWAEQERLLAG